MEVHTHTHSAHKKWTHYLWEFLMLFLAVFCGFLAENIREHQVEHQREKQYMRSLLADVREDSMEIRKSLSKAAIARQSQDTLMVFLYTHPPVNVLPGSFPLLDSNALLRLKIVFNEVTKQQLKNAGNLRLIRKENIIRRISLYWQEQENTQINLDRYLTYRARGRELSEKLCAFAYYYLGKEGLIAPSKGIRVLEKNPDVWTEYSNIVFQCNVTVRSYLIQLQKQQSMAEELISSLKKEYHMN